MNRAGTAALSLLAGILLLPITGWLYLRFGHAPVAVADPAFPFEEHLAQSTLHARIDRLNIDVARCANAGMSQDAKVMRMPISNQWNKHIQHVLASGSRQIGASLFPRTGPL